MKVFFTVVFFFLSYLFKFVKSELEFLKTKNTG